MTLIVFNKPYDVLSQFTDRGTAGSARRTLSDFIDAPGVYPAGRLDLDSEGLMLLTDDGRLQARISDPKFKMPKTYLVQVEGDVADDALESLRRGIALKDGPTRPAQVERIPDPALWPRDPPIRIRKNIPDCLAEADDLRRPQPSGAPHDSGHRASDVAARAVEHRQLDSRRPAVREVAMPPRVKVFFDGGWRPALGMETAVVVGGRGYFQRNLGPGSSMDAEWLALIHAVEIAGQLGLANAIILGDALAVLQQATGRVKCRGASVQHFRTLMALNRAPKIRYVKRTQNLAGIALARLHAWPGDQGVARTMTVSNSADPR